MVESYLHGSVTLDVFEDWFLANNWNAHLDAEGPPVELIHRIEGLLLDHSSDAINLESLRLELANAVRSLAEPCPS